MTHLLFLSAEPLLDQQVPSGQNPFYYHPAFYYPPDYYNYLPTLWARHYQEMASGWQNYTENKPSFGPQTGQTSSTIPGLNLPQPLNLPAMSPFTQVPFNQMTSQQQQQQQQGQQQPQQQSQQQQPVEMVSMMIFVFVLLLIIAC